LQHELEKAATPGLFLTPSDLHHIGFGELATDPRTVSHAHKLLHRVLTDAVKNGTLARNVAAIHAPPNVENEEIELGVDRCRCQ
jgi:hypothetical protein